MMLSILRSPLSNAMLKLEYPLLKLSASVVRPMHGLFLVSTGLDTFEKTLRYFKGSTSRVMFYMMLVFFYLFTLGIYFVGAIRDFIWF
jgi:hypothetical protein